MTTTKHEIAHDMREVIGKYAAGLARSTHPNGFCLQGLYSMSDDEMIAEWPAFSVQPTEYVVGFTKPRAEFVARTIESITNAQAQKSMADCAMLYGFGDVAAKINNLDVYDVQEAWPRYLANPRAYFKSLTAAEVPIAAEKKKRSRLTETLHEALINAKRERLRLSILKPLFHASNEAHGRVMSALRKMTEEELDMATELVDVAGPDRLVNTLN